MTNSDQKLSNDTQHTDEMPKSWDDREAEHQVMMLRIFNAEGVSTLDELEQRIVEAVHYKCDRDVSATTLESLNRRFGTKAKSFGVTVRQITEKLVLQHKLRLLLKGTRVFVVSKQYLDEVTRENPEAIDKLIEFAQ